MDAVMNDPHVDADVVDAEVGSLSDAALLDACRSEELRRRRTEGQLLRQLIEIERRKLHLGDGFRCLAGYGRAIHRWDRLEARSRRTLVRLAMVVPEVVDRLLGGRIGVAQTHLLGRLFCAPRVGPLVPMFIDEFFEAAADMDFTGFEQHCKTWQSLIDQDGSRPADWDRSAALGFAGDEHRLSATGPAIDGVKWQALLRRFEQIEWDRDWQQAKAIHGDDTSPSHLARTPDQRRYDALQNLRAHVVLPAAAEPVDPDDADVFGDGDTPPAAPPEPAAPAANPDGAVHTVVDVVVDIRTFLQGLDRMFAMPTQPIMRSPFGPGRAMCQTIDGVPIHPRDAVIASLYGKVRLVVTDDAGRPVQLTSVSRLFTGRLRDLVLMSATRCTHPGCLVRATDCQIDHQTPKSHGGPTRADNGALGCGHHNNWRYIARATMRHQPNGRWSTYRHDGSRITPPD